MFFYFLTKIIAMLLYFTKLKVMGISLSNDTYILRPALSISMISFKESIIVVLLISNFKILEKIKLIPIVISLSLGHASHCQIN